MKIAISTTMKTTINIPKPIPALKIPPTTSQDESSDKMKNDRMLNCVFISFFYLCTNSEPSVIHGYFC
jgi:hypothetical protein